jgi:hypothetical protein
MNMNIIKEPATLQAAKPVAPHLLDPGHLFEKIIRSWGAKSVLPLEPDTRKINYMPLERMALLKGTLKGTLVFRSSMEFSDWLQNQRSGTALGRYSEEEIFEELVSLFCLYLYHDFWNPDSFRIGPINPFRSVPQDWPQRTPSAFCKLLVDGYRVEIWLWLETSAHS